MKNEKCNLENKKNEKNEVEYKNYYGQIKEGKIKYPVQPKIKNPEDILSTTLYILDQMINYYVNTINQSKDCADSIVNIQKENEALKQEIESLKSRIKLIDTRNENILSENIKLQKEIKKYKDTAKNLYDVIQKYEEYFDPSNLDPEKLFDEAQKEYDAALNYKPTYARSTEDTLNEDGKTKDKYKYLDSTTLYTLNNDITPKEAVMDYIPNYAKSGLSNKKQYEPKLNTEQVKNKAKSEGQELIGWLADLIDSTFGQNWFDYNKLADEAKNFKNIEVK